MTRMTFPSPLVASIAYQNIHQEKLGRLRDLPTTESTIGTQKIAKIIKMLHSDTTVMKEKMTRMTFPSPLGKYSIPKHSPGKIRKVGRLSDHLEYHWDAKIID